MCVLHGLCSFLGTRVRQGGTKNLETPVYKLGVFEPTLEVLGLQTTLISMGT